MECSTHHVKKVWQTMDIRHHACEMQNGSQVPGSCGSSGRFLGDGSGQRRIAGGWDRAGGY